MEISKFFQPYFRCFLMEIYNHYNLTQQKANYTFVFTLLVFLLWLPWHEPDDLDTTSLAVKKNKRFKLQSIFLKVEYWDRAAFFTQDRICKKGSGCMLRCHKMAAEDLTFNLWAQILGCVYNEQMLWELKDKNDLRAKTNATFSVVLLKNASSVSEINKKIRLCGIHKMGS